MFAVASCADDVEADVFEEIADWLPWMAMSLAERGVEFAFVLVVERAELVLREALLNRVQCLCVHVGLEALIEVRASLLIEMGACISAFFEDLVFCDRHSAQ